MSALKALWDALNGLPRPITEEAALQVALRVCQEMGANQQEFKDWFDSEKATVLQMLNIPRGT